MTIVDLLIIYFAVGAPFGVYRITLLDGRPNARAVMTVALHVLLWPVFTILFLFDRWSSKDAVATDLIDSIRREIEITAFANGSASEIFDFRETFNRYAGLAEAVNAEAPEVALGEFFDLAGSESKSVASACVARRNKEKLIFHLTAARNDLIDLAASAATVTPDILPQVIQLADHLRDDEAVADLKALFPRESTSTVESTVRNSIPARL